MTKEEIYEKHLDELPKGADIKSCDVMVTIYRLSQLVELGIIDMPSFKITPKGFDIAYDLIEDGWIVSEVELAEILSELFELGPMGGTELIIGAVAVLTVLQHEGIDEIKDMLGEIEDDLKDEDTDE
jgi:hypothetical protein